MQFSAVQTNIERNYIKNPLRAAQQTASIFVAVFCVDTIREVFKLTERNIWCHLIPV